MLKLWENPMLSIEDRLEAASGEIDRLHEQIAAARNAILREGMQRDELLAGLESIANADPRKWEPDVRDQFQQWAQSRARHTIEGAGARRAITTHNAKVKGCGDDK